MMSDIVLLFIAVLACFFAHVASHETCIDPIEIAELRVLKSKSCVDISGRSGKGNVLTYGCDGGDDQQIVMCGDGTIRNAQSSYNCFTAGRYGRGNLVSTTCRVFPAIPDYQKWRFGRSKTFVDNGGIKQLAREIINVKSGRCIDVVGRDGTGNIVTYTCEHQSDQFFYFRSRGKLVAHGRMQNERSGLCLDVHGTAGAGNVLIYSCENKLDQYFNFYQNGELVNKKSRLCVDVSGSAGSGNVGMYACEDALDQMWTQPNRYCHGKYCSFLNKKSRKCLDVSGRWASKGSNVLAYACESAPDQRFKWEHKKWVTPNATWTLVGCNQNGKVTQKIWNKVRHARRISTSMSVDISATIEADLVFEKASVSSIASTSLAREWEQERSKTKGITVTCEHYDSGKPFTRGCMWQLNVCTRETEHEPVLSWSPQIIKCTSNDQQPKCPPFTRCKNEACTTCENLPSIRVKKAVGKSLKREELFKME